MLRWRIAILVGVAIAISYLDRQTLPVAVSAIARDIPLTNQRFSALQSAFLLSCALMYLGGGKLVDALGTRIGFALIMTFWSLANASHALATSFAMLMGSRFLLGMGEGGGFPAATRAVAEWFPAKDRATAMGIINAGTAVGAVVAPPLVAVVLIYSGWRWIFVVTGGLGLLWTWYWISSYFSPDGYPETGVRTQLAAFEPSHPTRRLSWIDLLRIRESWGLVGAKFLSDAAWYFYLFWLPKYLYDARGFDVKQSAGLGGSPPPLQALDVFWAAGFRATGKAPVLAGRGPKVSAGSERGGDAVHPAGSPPSNSMGPGDIQRCVFRAAIVVNLGNGASHRPLSGQGSRFGCRNGRFRRRNGGIAFGKLAGYLLDHGFGYGVVLSLAGTLHVVAFVITLATVPVVRPLNLERNMAYPGAR